MEPVSPACGLGSPGYILIQDMKVATMLVDLCSSLPEGSRRIAIDCEWHPYSQKLGLIQLHALGSTFLVDPLSLNKSILARLFTLPDILWVAHGFHNDARILLPAIGCLPHKIFDTAVGSAVLRLTPGKRDASLSDVILHYCDVKLRKDPKMTRSKWTRRPLTKQQLDYAADDVKWLLEAGRLMQIDLDRTGRSAWMEEDCAALLGRAMHKTNPPKPQSKWPPARRRVWQFLKPTLTSIAEVAGLHPQVLLESRCYDRFISCYMEKVRQGASIDILQSTLSALEKDLGLWRFQLVSEKLMVLLPEVRDAMHQHDLEKQTQMMANRTQKHGEADEQSEPVACAAHP